MKRKEIQKRTWTDDELSKIIAQAKRGDDSLVRDFYEHIGASKDASLLPAARKLASYPGVRDALGNIAYQSQENWIQTIDSNLLTQESMRNKLEDMSKMLLGDNPSYLERMLVSRVLVCWLQLYHIENCFVKKHRGDMSFQLINGYQQWLDRAHNRYLSAIKMLASIRRLQLPAVQVNIAEKQVNVAAGDIKLEPK